ncbi:MAG TPA: hypothetical protein VEG66_07290 [Thermoplasmata archaeon]|nr:hypothetical protein [Thermoplasmata archaeon]
MSEPPAAGTVAFNRAGMSFISSEPQSNGMTVQFCPLCGTPTIAQSAV